MAPASSQDADVFTIDPTEGRPDDEVATQLATTEIEDRCLTSVEVMQADWIPPFTDDIADRSGELPEDSNERITSDVLGLIFSPLGIGGNPEQGAQFLANTYVLTFASIATQQPVGATSNFDPETGAGTIEVPDLAPGLWAVAASCVFPDASDPDAYAAAIAAGTAFLVAEFGDPLDPTTILLALLGDPTIAEGLLREMLPFLMVPQETDAGPARWFAPFTVLGEAVPADPEVEAFCAAIPQLPALGEQLIETLAGLPEDDGSMSQDEWAAAEDWAALATELEGLVGQIEDLLAAGDTSRPDDLADEWASATAPLRQLRDALQAVDYDLSTESGRMIAGQLREQAVGAGEGEGEDPAVAALTQWFLANCLTEDTDDAEDTAPPATPRGAQPSYTG